MRIDKYLKVSRILKRREIGKELAINERLLINDKIAKPASEVKVGDYITICFGHREIKVRVKDIRQTASKAEAFEMYELIEEKKENEYN